VNNLFKQLRQPFPTDKLSFRPGAGSGDNHIALAYIDARDVMQRLDEFAGPEHWQCRYPFAGCCELSIAVPNDKGYPREWVTKTNCADESNIEAVKGQASDSFKRAAVLWGIGQYLYDSPNKWYKVENKKFTKIALQEIRKDIAAFSIEYFIDRDLLDETSGQIHAAIMTEENDLARGIWNDLTEIERNIMWRGGKYFTEPTKTLLRSTQMKGAE